MISLFSHVKWFIVDKEVGSDATLTSTEATVAGILTALGILILYVLDIWLGKNKFDKKMDKKTKSARPWVPTIVRLSFGSMLLLVSLYQGHIIAPNVVATNYLATSVIPFLLAVVGFSYIFGFYVRYASIILLFTYLLGFVALDLADILDHIQYVGFGLYLLFMGAGPFSLDRSLKLSKSSFDKYRDYAFPSLVIFSGLGLSMLALSEKLFNLNAGYAFLSEYNWNVLSPLGVSDHNFIILAGITELVVGLSFILRKAMRVTVSVVLLLMTITALVLGIDEVIGHLFAVGLVAVVWVNDRQPKSVKHG